MGEDGRCHYRSCSHAVPPLDAGDLPDVRLLSTPAGGYIGMVMATEFRAVHGDVDEEDVP
jgi:hypothetical protein